MVSRSRSNVVRGWDVGAGVTTGCLPGLNSLEGLRCDKICASPAFKARCVPILSEERPKGGSVARARRVSVGACRLSDLTPKLMRTHSGARS